MKKKMITALFGMIIAQSVWSQTGIEGRPRVTLENTSAVIVFDLGGGSLADFHLKDGGLNPFTWNDPAPGELKPQSM